MYLFFLIVTPFFYLLQISALALIMWWIFTAKRPQADLRPWGLTLIALVGCFAVAMSAIANVCFAFFDGWDQLTGPILCELFCLGGMALLVRTYTHLRPAGLVGWLLIAMIWIREGYILRKWIYPFLGVRPHIPYALYSRDDLNLAVVFWAVVLCAIVYGFGKPQKVREEREAS